MIDFEKIKSVYGLEQNLTMADIEILFQFAKTKSFPSKQILIREGEMRKEIYFIQKGLVRAYHINDKGDEKTTSIAVYLLPHRSLSFVNLCSLISY